VEGLAVTRITASLRHGDGSFSSPVPEAFRASVCEPVESPRNPRPQPINERIKEMIDFIIGGCTFLFFDD
jgi:hypothetical protein